MESRAVIYFNFGPYHLARVVAFGRFVPNVVGIQIARQDNLRPWRPAKEKLPFRLETLLNSPFETVPVREQVKAMHSFLNKEKPKVVVIAGYSAPVMRSAASWAKKNEAISILLCDSWKKDKPRIWVKEKIKALIIKRLYHAAFVSGQRSSAYIKSLGMADDFIWKGVDVVDNAYFGKNANMIRAKKDEFSTKLRLPQQYFLYVGRFSPEKNLPRLLQAYYKYRKKGGKWDLVLVGSGPQEQELKSLVQKEAIKGLFWTGFKQYDELPAYYSLASCFVLPSLSEPWGLVVNEAMACGLPILVSRHCGCLPELCHRGINGFDFDPLDIEGLAELMLRMSSEEIDLKSFSEASRRIVNLYTPETWARSLYDCIITMNKKKEL